MLAGFLSLQGAGASPFAVYLGGGLAAVAALLLLLGLRTGQGALLCLATLLLPLGLGLVPHLPTTTAGYSSWLGGSLRLPANREIYIDSVLKPLGFQLFPWVALLPAALATLLRPTLAPDAGPLAEDPSEARERFVRTLLNDAIPDGNRAKVNVLAGLLLAQLLLIPLWLLFNAGPHGRVLELGRGLASQPLACAVHGISKTGFRR